MPFLLSWTLLRDGWADCITRMRSKMGQILNPRVQLFFPPKSYLERWSNWQFGDSTQFETSEKTWLPISGLRLTSMFPNPKCSSIFLAYSFNFIVFDSGLLLVLRSKQLWEQEEVDVVLPLDKDKGITLEDFKLIKMHMANCTSFLSISLVGFGFV